LGKKVLHFKDVNELMICYAFCTNVVYTVDLDTSTWRNYFSTHSTEFGGKQNSFTRASLWVFRLCSKH